MAADDYWGGSYWGGSYWGDSYWGEIGSVEPAPTPTRAGAVTVSRFPDDLAMLALLLICRRRRKRRITI